MDKDAINIGTIVSALLLVMALLARLGLLAYTVGLTRSKHAAATAGRALLDLCFAGLAFWLVGAAIAIGPNDYVGFNVHAMFGGAPQAVALASVVLASGFLAGGLSERCGFWPSMWAAVALGAVVVPLPLRWMTNGWLANLGLVGVDPFPIAGAAFTAMGIWAIGPRLNKYHRDGSTSLIPGHNLPLAVVGSVLALIGLVAFYSVRTMRPDLGLFAVAAGGVAATVATQVKFGRPDIGLVLTGVLGAAVAVTVLGTAPGFHHVLVGLIAGLVVPHCAVTIDTQYRLDDPPAGVTIFGVGGIIGMIATGLFYPSDAVARLKMVGLAGLAIIVIAIWAAAVGWVVFTLLKRLTRLRVREADEFDGLDLAELDVAAYPDFQQNTIRSFHMREA
ncbi:MAG TPA: hypothetical protein VGN72_00725 [Tepidisphaeraceae bacterium]|nr:hypothetical protein [Tepidisphaeraceae bacterium]